jgi:hypothetical protein
MTRRRLGWAHFPTVDLPGPAGAPRRRDGPARDSWLAAHLDHFSSPGGGRRLAWAAGLREDIASDKDTIAAALTEVVP